MVAYCAQLFAVMDQQLQYYQELYQLLEEQQVCLLGRKVENLEANNEAIDQLEISLTTIEVERQALTQKLCTALGNSSVQRLDHIASLLPPHQGNKLQAIGDQLSDTLGQIEDIQDQNRTILTQSLAFVNFSLSVMESSPFPAAYGRQGRQNKEKRNLFMKDM